MKRTVQDVMVSSGKEVCVRLSVTAWYPRLNGSIDPTIDAATVLKSHGGKLLRALISQVENPS